MKARFLNVDLEIESRTKLDSLAAEMGKQVCVLYSGPAAVKSRRFLNLENSRCFKGPDAAIHAFCSVIEKLSPAAKRVWNVAQKKFDVGYELRPEERALHFQLRPDTLERIVRLGATLAVTCYREEPSK